MEQTDDAGLSQSPSLPVSKSLPFPVGVRLRDRLFPVLTVSIAFLWVFGAIEAAEYVGSMNTTRAIAALMAGPMSSSAAMPSFLGNTSPSRPTASQVQEQQQLKQQIATLEVMVYVWRVAMFVVAGLLAAVALISAITGRARGWHLLAVFLILASTVGTLIGLRLLTRPEWAGMPPVSVLSYISTAVAQSAYGIILLIAFARKPKVEI